jgi:exopolysaccharide biosynthesis protein
MTGLGCKDVLNLDGGGSSMFLTGSEGTLQNNPSDGRQRKVLSFVSIMEKVQ